MTRENRTKRSHCDDTGNQLPPLPAPKPPKARANASWEKPPRVCIIGAGCSGLVALKALRQRGLSPVVFEMGRDLGGLWVFENSNGRGGAYRSLHINTSTTQSQFSDFPMPSNIGQFPHHHHIAAYLKDYACHFDLLQSIAFEREVKCCHPITGEGPSSGDDGYVVSVEDKQTGACADHIFDAVVVANGHHWSPSFPEPNPARTFEGVALHSGRYIDPKSPEDLREKDVIVVGMGNSAVDIACELSRVGGAKSVTLSYRRGAYVLPKFLFGRPIDQGTLIPRFLPDRLRRQIATTSFEWLMGKMSDYGLPDPDHLIGEAHPTISSDLPVLVACGDISVKREIVACQGNDVFFADETHRRADVIIFATGYKIEFPFLPESHIQVRQNALPLYLRSFHPLHRRLFFVGLLQTVGAVFPTAEAQAELIALHLSGEYNLPPTHEMLRDIERQDSKMAARFVSSPRHTMQIVPEDFIPRVRREKRAGKRRRALGTGIPFPPNDIPGATRPA